jgi:hypothetical protein
MRAERVIKTLLEADSGVTGLVGTRIYAGQIPQQPTLPCIGFSKVSSIDVPPISASAGQNIAQGRIQVTAFAADYPATKTVLEAVYQALRYRSGLIATVTVISVLPDVEGPDIYDPDLAQFYQSRDFLITHYQ